MTELKQQTEKQKQKKNFFELMMEVVGWVQIVVSPLLLGAIIGSIIYFSRPNYTRLVIAISVASIGLIIGIVWATRVWKKRGTIYYLSRISAISELDNDDKME